MAGSLLRPLRRGRKGQAMTELVLLFPMFLIIFFLTSQIFALLVLVQKLEIGSYYAARRWQLESHLSADHMTWDDNSLLPDIKKNVSRYLGFDNQVVRDFLGLSSLDIKVVRTQVWNIVTVTVGTKRTSTGTKLLCKFPKQAVCTSPYGAACMSGHDYICGGGRQLQVIKYVPNRDRPVQFVLPGIK